MLTVDDFSQKNLSCATIGHPYGNKNIQYIQLINESGEKFFIKKILAPSQPKLCIDIGANIGNYTLELLKLTNAKVISFEPLPITFDKLKEKIEREIIKSRKELF